MTDEIKQAADAAAAATQNAVAETGALATTVAEEAADTAHEAASEAGTSFKDGAANFAKQAAEKARDLAADGKTRAGDALDEVSRLMDSAANTVDEKLGANYGKYARSAAEGIAGFSESLKAKDVDDLVADVQGFVRKSPAVAIGIAAAVGFVVARLVKAGIDGAETKAADNKTGPDAAVDA